MGTEKESPAGRGAYIRESSMSRVRYVAEMCHAANLAGIGVPMCLIEGRGQNFELERKTSVFTMISKRLTLKARVEPAIARF